ncbi:MAG: hypothetical protein HY533_03400, partial [Chloroflexi bacterium]|nr:hypothetical protein [Chloroflexota bacterium]
PNTVGTPCSPLAAGDCNVTTGSGIDTVKTQYHWFWTCGNYVLVSSDATTYDITLYVNGTGAMESWQSSRNYPLPLGKFSFSISSLERVAAASWSVTKNGDPFASGDLLGNLALEGPDNYPFDAAHEGSGPDHGAGLYMNDILALDSWAKNDTSGGNRVRIIDPPSFTLDTDAAADYEVTLTFTIKDGETGTVVTKSATTNIAVQYEPAEPPLPLCTT